MSRQYYIKTAESCTVKNELISLISTANWKYVPYFYVIDSIIPENIYKDTFLNQLRNSFVNSYLNIYKIPPKTFYHWHTDSGSKCSVNMVLKDYKSHTIFSDSGPYENRTYDNNITELQYEPLSWYLFNTQYRHCVINLDETPRYLMTFRFPQNITYHDLLKWYNDR